jgi:acid phosphatase type 7
MYKVTLILFLSFIAKVCFCQTTLVAAGSNWKYLDNGSDQGISWKNNGFNDISWPAGNAELGYGDGDETTVVGYGGNSSNKYITTYFRKSFNSASTFSSYLLKVRRDDGVVVYINGNEVFRDNLSGTVTYNTLSSAATDDGQTWLTAELLSNSLQVGSNTIAVEIHQTLPTSSDVSFDLELIGRNGTTITRGPYLQMATSTSMQIRWRTDVATSSKISYGLDSDALTSSTTDAAVTTEHIINLTGLLPNTTYYYSVGSMLATFQATPQNYFITAPAIGTEKKIRIWVTGDCGTGVAMQTQAKTEFLNYVGNQYIDLWLLLGDNAYYSGYDTEYQTKFFEPYQTDRIMKQTALFPSPGNHDYGATATAQDDHVMPYYDNFSLPTNAEIGGVASGTEAYYSFNYANIHFVSLDSYGRESGKRIYETNNAQLNWLKQDLQANNQKWTVLYWHHPPYTKGSHNSDTEDELKFVRENVIPIVEQYKVDLILCGHSHIYERSKLMKGYYGLANTFDAALHNPSTSSAKYNGTANSCPYIKYSDKPNNGVVYVVSGSAGWTGPTSAGYPHNAMHYSNNTHAGSLYLEIEGNRLDAKWIANATVADQFTILKDVINKKQTVVVNDNVSSVELKASWMGAYFWPHNSSTSKNITITPPIQNSEFIVKDNLSCLSDTFKLNLVPIICQPALNLTTEIGVLSSVTYQSGQTIVATNLVNTQTNVIYKAANSVSLLPGFQTNAGSNFKATIEGCPLTTIQNGLIYTPNSSSTKPPK